MEQQKNSDVFLRPRFKIDFNESQQEVIKKFADNSKNQECKYCTKIVDGHIIIKVPEVEDKFWSPQLNIEIESVTKNKSVLKGLFGPKDQVWTFFMFIHFGMAVAFIGFSIIAYVKYVLKEDFSMALFVVIGIPILWILMYFMGRWGKSSGRKQMEELHEFMIKTLEK
ncbi:GTP-binding protein [Lutibacter sp.]|uniref:GTP-binding protein n=1 Tax=Lutibacter sp. TaxID=1925666 RepID=UPI00273607AC|nr:GTP-binding protein [Lutibacter sp.]MDP3313691.1 GTP-binding protein [Lutibacter sp.]